MIELGHRSGLGQESIDLLTAREFPGADHLERHQATETPFQSLVDNPHAAPAEFLD